MGLTDAIAGLSGRTSGRRHRAAAIEQGPGRPAALAADVRSSAEGFSAVADGMPPQAWQRTVRWGTGHEAEAALIVPMRLGEVLIHVDLDIGYQPQDWPAACVSDYLDRAVTALIDCQKSPASYGIAQPRFRPSPMRRVMQSLAGWWPGR